MYNILGYLNISLHISKLLIELSVRANFFLKFHSKPSNPFEIDDFFFLFSPVNMMLDIRMWIKFKIE